MLRTRLETLPFTLPWKRASTTSPCSFCPGQPRSRTRFHRVISVIRLCAIQIACEIEFGPYDVGSFRGADPTVRNSSGRDCAAWADDATGVSAARVVAARSPARPPAAPAADVRLLAEHLGIAPAEEAGLMWVAAAALRAPLPIGWVRRHRTRPSSPPPPFTCRERRRERASWPDPPLPRTAGGGANDPLKPTVRKEDCVRSGGPSYARDRRLSFSQ